MPTYSDPAKNIEYSKLWHLKHRERRLQERRERYLRKREIELKQSSEYRRSHPEVNRSAQKKWRDKNKAYNAARQHKYRAIRYSLQREATVNLEAITAWFTAARSKKDFVCYYCHKKREVSDLHFDHIIPLSRGGQHSVANLCKCCSYCNHTKSNKPVRLWIQQGQQLLEL